MNLDLSTNCAWDKSNEAREILSVGGSDEGPTPDALYHMINAPVQYEPIGLDIRKTIAIPLASPPDQVTQSSLVRLINYFGHQIMLIYDAILADKRIIFSGSRNLSITQI